MLLLVTLLPAWRYIFILPLPLPRPDTCHHQYSNECCEFSPHLSPRSTQAHDCYSGCGDISDITTSGATFAPETDCNLPCSGDPIHLCGGPLRLSVYFWNSTTNPLYVWNTPANTGYYEVSSPIHHLLYLCTILTCYCRLVPYWRRSRSSRCDCGQK